MMNFGGKPPLFGYFFGNFWITRRKRDPCLETFGPNNPSIGVAHDKLEDEENDDQHFHSSSFKMLLLFRVLLII